MFFCFYGELEVSVLLGTLKGSGVSTTNNKHLELFRAEKQMQSPWHSSGSWVFLDKLKAL